MRKKIMDAITAHVAAEYPKEACGLVVQIGRAQEYVPCTNASHNPTEHFLIPPEEKRAAEKLGTILMVIHSHPDVPQLIPSEMDRVQCDYSGVEWGIMSWPDGDFCTISPRGERELIGRQWVLGFADCWTLIMDYYRQEHGITLNNWSVDYEWWQDGRENRYDDKWEAEGFVQVDPAEMRTGDIIMMRIQSQVTNHAAIYLGDNIILHHNSGNLSTRVPYGDYWRNRTVRVVRKKELMDA
ncbi:C40 family peptidase [Pantoea sp.]|uniref:C40 family peptidase n=1 Tax=Pantoea sp. TaxID=69393 RepID=UPI0031E01015